MSFLRSHFYGFHETGSVTGLGWLISLDWLARKHKPVSASPVPGLQNLLFQMGSEDQMQQALYRLSNLSPRDLSFAKHLRFLRGGGRAGLVDRCVVAVGSLNSRYHRKIPGKRTQEPRQASISALLPAPMK